MDVVKISLIIFIVLELLNIALLYFIPETKLGNGVGVFNSYEESRENENTHQFIKYLIYWVAGCKLIFLGLLIGVVIVGNDLIQIVTVGILIPTIASFYYKLYPIIKRMDECGAITPKGYSKTLSKMILSFLIMFSIVFAYAITTL